MEPEGTRAPDGYEGQRIFRVIRSCSCLNQSCDPLCDLVRNTTRETVTTDLLLCREQNLERSPPQCAAVRASDAREKPQERFVNLSPVWLLSQR
jgi:hypothetical protein